MSHLEAEISKIVAWHVAAGEIAGGVTVISRDGEVEVFDVQGVADFDTRFILCRDSVFGVMSMTKPVIAACAALLIAEGRMSPADLVSRWIPSFAVPRFVRTLQPGEAHPPFPPDGQEHPAPKFDYAPAHRNITVHDLLNFTSGLQTIGIPNSALPDATAADTLASWAARLGEVPLEFQPGAQWHYSNATGYDVVGRIIEVVSGQDLDVFARERLFAPLGMDETGFGVQPWMDGRLVPLGILAGERIARADFPSGSAGLFSTITNYWRFAQMLLGEGVFRGKQIMPKSAVAMMTTNQIGTLTFPGIRAAEYASREGLSNPGLRYGYGVGIVADRARAGLALPAGSYGWDGIGTRRFWVIPALRSVLIMLMSGIGPVADRVHAAIEEAVCREYA